MPRYSVRWSNGFWKIFDHVRFADVDKAGTQRLAQDNVDPLNAGRKRA
jgi:hypothetical protein